MWFSYAGSLLREQNKSWHKTRGYSSIIQYPRVIPVKTLSVHFKVSNFDQESFSIDGARISILSSSIFISLRAKFAKSRRGRRLQRQFSQRVKYDTLLSHIASLPSKLLITRKEAELPNEERRIRKSMKYLGSKFKIIAEFNRQNYFQCLY